MIATGVLQELADYLNDRVAKVVINGTLAITDFRLKEVTGGALALHYYVWADEVTQIDLIELRAADEQVLASYAVNIPVTADQLLIQSIEVKEVTS